MKSVRYRRFSFQKGYRRKKKTIADALFIDTSALFKRYMKPIDSIQLAIALNLKRDDVTFVSSDRRLCKISAEDGLDTLTP
jgi:hypothetical protein